MTPRPPLDELLSLLGATLAAEGVTTDAGTVAGDNFIDAGLKGAGDNSFVSMLAVLYPSQPLKVDSKDIIAFDNATGKVTLAGAYKGVAAIIPAGVPYKIVTFRFTPAEVAAIEAKLDHAGHGLAALAAALAEILEDTGTDLEAKLDALYPYHGLVYYGMVTGITGAPKFQCSGLVGFGDDFFEGYWAYVVWDAGGLGGAPQGEMLQCTGYDSDAGDFTVAAYTAAIAAEDRVLLLHPAIASLINTTYGLSAIKDLIDAVEAKLDAQKGATGIFHEQADVAVSINATAGAETDVLNLAVADTRYIVRSLRLKCADPVAETVTVRLHELVFNVLTEIDSFAITNANFATYHSLMDMFGLNHLAGDQLQVTVRVSAGADVAVTGQYSHSKTNV